MGRKKQQAPTLFKYRSAMIIILLSTFYGTFLWRLNFGGIVSIHDSKTVGKLGRPRPNFDSNPDQNTSSILNSIDQNISSIWRLNFGGIVSTHDSDNQGRSRPNFESNLNRSTSSILNTIDRNASSILESSKLSDLISQDLLIGEVSILMVTVPRAHDTPYLNLALSSIATTIGARNDTILTVVATRKNHTAFDREQQRWLHTRSMRFVHVTPPVIDYPRELTPAHHISVFPTLSYSLGTSEPSFSTSGQQHRHHSIGDPNSASVAQQVAAYA